jgi:hypothetical protein
LDGIAQVTGYWPKAEVMNVPVNNPHIRAWRHRKPAALAVALGRPNREQVCTVRNEESTVLQSLELVNGKALAERLQQGSRLLLASDLRKEENPAKMVSILYRRALSRLPNDKELSLAVGLLSSAKEGSTSSQEAWEDMLWALFVSPEFQFVR